MGRPKAKEVREIPVSFRLTPAEFVAISERAADTGFEKVPAFCRAAALTTTPYAARPEATGPTYLERAYHEEVKRWGVNLNQIARHVNTHPDKPIPSELEPVLSMIREFLDRELSSYGP